MSGFGSNRKKAREQQYGIVVVYYCHTSAYCGTLFYTE